MFYAFLIREGGEINNMKKIISALIIAGLFLGVGIESSLAAVVTKPVVKKTVVKKVVKKKVIKKKVVKPTVAKPIVVPPPRPIVIPPPRPVVVPPPPAPVAPAPAPKPLMEIGGSVGLAGGLAGTPSGSTLGVSGKLSYLVMDPISVRVGVDYIQSDQATRIAPVMGGLTFKMALVSLDGIYNLGKLMPDILPGEVYVGGGVNYPVKISSSTLGETLNGAIGGQAFVGLQGSGIMMPNDEIYGELGYSVQRIQNTTSFKGISLMVGYMIGM